MQEDALDTKLRTVVAEWSAALLTFADYGTRGPVVLKASDTAELIERLEESQVGGIILRDCWGLF